MIRWEAKRPDEVRDYQHDWSAFLDEDTITGTPTVTVEGVTKDSQAVAGSIVKVWLSGGTDGTIAHVTQTIVTAAGRTETERFSLRIGVDEPVTLAEAKAYLRVTSDDEDAKIEAMIPRARAWVEDHTGLALVRRSFIDRLTPLYGAIRLSKGPLVLVDEISYVDTQGADQTYVPRFWEGQSAIFPASGERWPVLGPDEAFEITYTAGIAEGEVDERLIGAMLALIEGEFSEGYAYPQTAIDAADRCCGYLRQMVA